MTKRLSTFLYLSAFALSISAVPALRQKHLIKLTDGSSIQATLMGDEFLHYYQDIEGRTYRMDESGLYRQDDLKEAIVYAKQRLQVAAQRRQARNSRKYAPVPGATPKMDYTGHKRCLVILADFSDYYMTYTPQEYDRYFNELGYSENGMKGSVRDYFLACSYGQLDIQFDIVGPVSLKKSVKYYGTNDSHGYDHHPGQMVSEAIQAAENKGVDFSLYDWDGDKVVDQVFVIYAGYGEAQSGIESNIWPQEGKLSEKGDYGDGTGALKFDGVTIDMFATSCELSGRRGLEIDGIGTACHEFSHCMGLPDTYDALNNATFGMDVWDIMDYGCYNGIGGKIGSCPWEFTSYERTACGWLTPTVLKAGCEVRNMRPLNQAPEAYIIYNDGNRNEYYLLENRQLQGFDEGGYGHGMLVIHVDYDKDIWSKNFLNIDNDRQRMTIIPADGSLKSLAYGVSYVAGDPFPGTKGKTSLTDETLPKASLYNTNTDGRKLMHKPITGITENTSTGTISFVFNGGGTVIDAVDSPATATEISGDAYDIQGRKVTEYHKGMIIKNGKKFLR